jgi:arsenite-transporting ATPase
LQRTERRYNLDHRHQVLIISTDPAHNLSDCFDQKFSKEATPVQGIENLYAMEIDPTIDPDKLKLPTMQGFEHDQGTKNLLSELISSVPGIDEAMSFAELMKYRTF